MTTKALLRAALEHRRPGVTSDEDWGQLTVIKEYEHLPLKDKVLLDVGGNIGAFAIWAAMNGCKKVYTFEPEQENFRLLSYNTYPWAEQVVPVRAALVPHHEKEVNLWLTGTKTMGSCSTEHFRGRDMTVVPARNFEEVIEEVMPDGIKMDCEGAEWDLLDYPLPACVKDVAAELHFTKRHWREISFPWLLDWMNEQGFSVIKEPKNTGKNWHTIAHWRRP